MLFAGADITRAAAGAPLPHSGIARSFQIPQPFGGMTVFENLVVAAAFGARPARARRLSRAAWTSSRAAGSPTRPTATPAALTLLDRKRLELARALATGPRVLLLDEVAGGLTEHECVALVDADQGGAATGVSIIWIEHVVHALIAAVDRLVVLHNGGFIAEGDPQRGDPQPRRSPKSIWGSPPMPERRCLSVHDARRVLRRLPGAVRRLDARSRPARRSR